MARTTLVQKRSAVPTVCTPDTERCPDGHNYLRDTPECCKQHQRDVMFGVLDACKEAGVRVCLGFGSLLGAYRNPLTTWKDYYWLPQNDRPAGLVAPGIIPHDKDGDLIFLAEDWDKLLGIVPTWSKLKGQRTGSALGLEWQHRLPVRALTKPGDCNYSGGDSVKVRRSAVNHVNVDLFPYYDRPFQKAPKGWRHRYHFVGVDKCKGRDFPEDKLLPFGEIEWEGRTVPCPNDPEWFCKHWYRETWKKPLPRNNWGRRVP